jgi:OmpA-OmpF porin, OOP family
MKNTARFCVAVLASLSIGIANAAKTGAYVGAGLGYSQSDASNLEEDYYQVGNSVFHLYNTSLEEEGLGGRVFGGYNFNPYLGLELGVSRYADTQYKYTLDSETYGNPFYYGRGNGKLTYSFTTLDLVGKAYLPLGNSGFDIYGLIGASEVFVKAKTEYSAQYYNVFGSSIGSGSASDTDNYHELRPKFGVGINYALNQNIAMNLEVSRIQGNENEYNDGDADNYVPNLDMASLSLTYHFG